MKLTIELDTATDLEDEKTIALLGGSVLLAILANEVERVGRKAPTEPPGDDDDEPGPRIYGQAEAGKTRRTKAQIAEDEDIERRWAALWPSKAIPKDRPAEDLLSHIEKVEADQPEEKEDDEEFDLGEEDEDTPTDEDPIELEEFRAVVVKAAKALGSKKIAELMKPHKGTTEVPEDDRRDYVRKIEEALADA